MAIVLLATSPGYQQLAPGGRYERVREGQEVVWHWPIVPEGKKPEGKNRVPPKRWTVLHTLGDVELAERMAEQPEPNTDAIRRGGNLPPEPEERGSSDADQKLIRTAVGRLDAKDGAAWTAKDKPQVEAVRNEIELMGHEQGQATVYPKWLTRDALDAASDRKRKDS